MIEHFYKDLSDKTLNTHRFSNIQLPISIDPLDYGVISAKNILETFTSYIVNSSKRVYQIDISLDGLINNVTILGLSDFKWTDTKQSEGFKRDIGKSNYVFY